MIFTSPKGSGGWAKLILSWIAVGAVADIAIAIPQLPWQAPTVFDIRGAVFPSYGPLTNIGAPVQPALFAYVPVPSSAPTFRQDYHDAAVVVSDSASAAEQGEQPDSAPSKSDSGVSSSAVSLGTYLKEGFHPASDRQSHWFYGLNIPSPMTLLMEPLISITPNSNLPGGNLPSMDKLFPEAVALFTPKSSAQPTFRGAVNRRARATLAILGRPETAGEAFFYQSSASADVTVVFTIAGAPRTAKDVFVVTSNSLPADCTGATSANVYNPQNVVNGGYIAKPTANSATASLINKQVSNTIISLYDPYSIIGRSLVVFESGGAVEACGVIVEV